MIFKRYTFLKRAPLIPIYQFFFPILLLMILSHGMSSGDDSSFRTLTLQDFQNPVALLSINDTQSEFAKQYKRSNVVKEVQNISEYSFKMSKSSPSDMKIKYIIGASFDNESVKIPVGNSDFTFSGKVTTWFNNDPYHTPGIALAATLNAIYRTIMDCDDCTLLFVNHPLPAGAEKMVQESATSFMSKTNLMLTFTLFISISYSIVFVVTELTSQAKHLQFVSGVKVFIFWSSTFLYDLIIWIAVLLFCCCLVYYTGMDGYKASESIERLALLILLMGWAMLPAGYIFAFAFKNTSIAHASFLVLNAAFVILAIFLTIYYNSKNEDISNMVLWIPHYAFYCGLSDMYTMYSIDKLCTEREAFCKQSEDGYEDCMFQKMELMQICTNHEKELDYFKMERRGIGKPCIALFITGLVLIMILILFETGIFSQVSSFGLAVIFKKKTMVDEVEDEDVGKEREKVKNTRREDLLKNNIIVTEDLTKFYGSHLAVNKICLAIKKSECFGLLGVNGAGKTTTFKILTGDIAATSGEGWVNGYSLKRHMNKVRKHIGYCPQFDAFLEILTVRDTLHLFALIRGVPSSRCDRTIEQLAKDFDFEQHVDKQVTHLSGGNKRKLSSALALLGDPSVIYLDEPTAGMDPATKKYLVNGLTKIRDSGKCIVLTSHNLEEAEALCTRVAIMVNGRFQCLGSIQHLKNKFAKGFFFTIKIQRQLNQGARRNRETKQLPRMPASP